MPPPGCELKMQNESEYCPPDSFPEESEIGDYARGLQNGTWVCQSCNPDDDAYPWTYADWILTSRPHVLGLMPGPSEDTLNLQNPYFSTLKRTKGSHCTKTKSTDFAD